MLATAFYGLRKLDPDDVRRTFAPLYWFLVHKWWFDELYAVPVRPAGAAHFRLGRGDRQAGHRLAGRQFGPGGRG